MKQVYVLILMVGLMASQNSYAQQSVVLDKIVAKVGGEVIFQSDVNDKITALSDRNKTLSEEDKCTILASLMAQAMLVHYAKLDSVVISDEEVSRDIDRKMEQILSYMNNDRKLFQDFYGQTVSDMREMVREPTMRKMLAERMQYEIMDKVVVTPGEVIDYFNSIPKDSLPYFNAEVELSEIVLFPKVNYEERAKALEKIKQVQDKLSAGEDFATLAKKYSDDGSSAQGGELGWVSRGQFVAEFEASAFQLEPNQISDIVESEFGFHIIQLQERRGNSIRTRHILVRPKITPEDREITKMKLDSIRQLIEVDSLTFEQAVTKFGDKRVQSHSNSGRMINPKTSNTFFEVGDIDSEIFFAIDTLSVGEITAPLEYRSGIEDYYYKIVKLQARTTPHRANLKEDYNRIQEAAKENKKNMVFSRWVEKRVDDTYIVVDKSYNHCEILKDWGPQWTE